MSVLQFAQEAEASADAETNVVSFREARARRIRELSVTWANNTLQLGKELLAVRDTFPPEKVSGSVFRRPGWREWCRDNLDLTDSYASKLIRIYEKLGADGAMAPPAGGFRLLEFLARDTTPESARQEVIERIDRGEVVGQRTAEKIADQHKRPPPKEARKIARETGTPTEASDGNIYFGASKEEEQRIEARRDRVFAIRHAVTALATISMTPEEFLADTPAHLLWTREEEEQLSQAAEWLMDLLTAWESRR